MSQILLTNDKHSDFLCKCVFLISRQFCKSLFLFSFPSTAASARHNAGKLAAAPPPPPNKKSPQKQGAEIVQMKTPIIAPPIESPVAVNHLFIGHKSNKRNRHVTDAPRIAHVYPKPGTPHAQTSANAGNHSNQMNGGKTEKSNIRKSAEMGSQNSVSSGVPSEGSEDSVVDGQPGVAKRIDRSMSDGQSSDGYLSEASNNTRGSATRTIDLESDSDTIGDKDAPDEAPDVANLKDVEDVKELIDLQETKENQETEHEDPSEVSTEGKDSVQKDSEKCSEEVVFQAETAGTDTSETVENGNVLEKDVKGSEAVVEDEAANLKENEKTQIPSPSSNNNAGEPNLSEITRLSLEAASRDNISANSSPETSPSAKKPSADHIAKFTQEFPNNVPNTATSPTHSFHSDMESYLNAKQLISGKTSPSVPQKSFSPFQNRPLINERRAQNGLRLGLYSPEDITQQNSKKSPGGSERVVNSIGRAQINACLHRQYMVEVKQQAKHRKH